MTNPFEKASNEVKQEAAPVAENPVASVAAETETETPVTTYPEVRDEEVKVGSNTGNSSEQEIPLDSLVSLNYVQRPKAKGDKFEEEYTVDRFIKKPGKTVIPTDGSKPFWSGLEVRDSEGNIKEKLDEFHVVLLNKQGQECYFKLSSWEEYYKFVNFAKFANASGLQTKGFKMHVERIDFGPNTKNGNFIFYFARGETGYKVSGKKHVVEPFKAK